MSSRPVICRKQGSKVTSNCFKEYKAEVAHSFWCIIQGCW